MAISAIVEKKAIEGYIKSNGNKTQVYLNSHPQSDIDIAYSEGSRFTEKYGIEEKAIATVREIAGLDPELSAQSFLNGFKQDMTANKTLFYKGKRYNDIPHNSVRANSRLQLFDRLYPTNNISTAIQNNVINVNPDNIEKMNKGLSELFEKTNQLIDKLNNAKEI